MLEFMKSNEQNYYYCQNDCGYWHIIFDVEAQLSFGGINKLTNSIDTA